MTRKKAEKWKEVLSDKGVEEERNEREEKNEGEEVKIRNGVKKKGGEEEEKLSRYRESGNHAYPVERDTTVWLPLSETMLPFFLFRSSCSQLLPITNTLKSKHDKRVYNVLALLSFNNHEYS